MFTEKLWEKQNQDQRITVQTVYQVYNMVKRMQVYSYECRFSIMTDSAVHQLLQLSDPAYIAGFLEQSDADDAFVRCLQEIPWEERIWNNNKPLPRLVYRYDSDARENAPIVILEELMLKLETLMATKVTGVWCNLYRNGKDHTPYHRDEYGAHVMTLSLGAIRKFLMKTNDGDVTSYQLQHGDMFYFSPQQDRLHKHSIPKQNNGAGQRVSLVFFCNPPFSRIKE
eukprot:TRINITY_DN4936_c0_g1_i12.p3 TRINITY_DN4936_c0_g1~~TRINITY_DN4936_c0_g1_i12.p3  ORF type:complete len:226 (-),score=10.74 TRINITY_DN4936_c0_g1_i12:1146-1823(-)